MAESARIEELRLRLDREPGSRLFAQLAEELRKAGDVAAAATVARRGLAQHPGYTSARLTLARALLALGEDAVARAELETVLRAAPDNILASRLLGNCLIAMGDLGSALLQLRATLRLSGADPGIEAEIGVLEERLRAGGSESFGGEERRASDAALSEPSQVAEGSEVGRSDAGEGVLQAERAPESPIQEAEAEAASASGWKSSRSEIDRSEAQPRGVAEASWVSMGPVGEALLGAWPDEGGSPGAGVAGDAAAISGAEPGGISKLVEAAGEQGEPGPQRQEEKGEDAPSVISATLAELYFGQGSPEKAVEVYRELLRREPTNEKARERAREIETQLRGGSAVGPEGEGRSERVGRAIGKLERWLETLQAARRSEPTT